MTGAPVGQPVVADGVVFSVAVRPRAAQVAAASRDGALEIWNTAAVLPIEGGAVAFSPDGQRLAVGTVDGLLTVYDPRTGKSRGRTTIAHPHSVTRIAYAADGRHLVSGDFNGNVWIWKVEDSVPVGAPVEQATGSSISSIAYSTDGHQFAVGNQDGVVRRGDTETGQLVGSPMSAPGAVAAVAFTTDDTEIVSVHGDLVADPTVRRWNAQSGELLATESIGLLTVAALGPGAHLATGTVDGLVTVYGADTKPIKEPVSGSTSTVTALAFSPAGDRLASGDQYGSIRMWLPDKGTPIGKTFGGDSSLVLNLALSPDGRQLASADVLGMVGLWPATGSVADLCAKLTSNMSHRQWNDWVSPDIDYVKTCPDLPIAPD